MSAQKTKAAGHLAAIFTMLIWGTTFISTKVLLEDLSPLEILVLRFVAGYIFLWIIRPVPLKAGSLERGDHDRGRYYGDRYLLSYGKHCPDFDTGIEYQRYCIDRPILQVFWPTFSWKGRK